MHILEGKFCKLAKQSMENCTKGKSKDITSLDYIIENLSEKIYGNRIFALKNFNYRKI